MEKADAILHFWFKEIEPQQWFVKDLSFDQLIRDRFLEDHRRAMNGDYDAWREDPRGSLALIILLDQFSRNMFRDTPNMFASDNKALVVAKHAIESGHDQLMTAQERVFCYLPFEHS